MQTVTATDLARNTRKIIDSVSNGETVVVERNHAQVARIVPAEVTMTARDALADLRVTLAPRQAAAWLDESRGEFGDSLCDPWA
jgi:antitoxin (DNA-binding transcriptional repressor) of toxin-antitoxin stability system